MKPGNKVKPPCKKDLKKAPKIKGNKVAKKKKPNKIVEKNPLTIKQDNFCLEFIKHGNASEAYRMSYNCGKMKLSTIARNAHALLKCNNIATRIEELRTRIADKAIMKAAEIQERLTSHARGETEEESIVVVGVGKGFSEATKENSQIKPKDQIKALETLAKVNKLLTDGASLNVIVPQIIDDIE